QETKKSKVKGCFAFSETSIFFLDTIANLKEVADFTEILDVLRHIKDKNKVFSSLFEGRVFADYRNRKMNISSIPEATEQNNKTSDFIVQCHKSSVFIECKSLEDKVKLESRIWKGIEGKIVKDLGKHQRCWFVSIDASRSIEGKDVTEITNLVLNKIKKNDLSAVFTSDNKISINFQQICEPNVWYDAPVSLAEKKEMGWFEMEFRIGSNKQPQYCNVAGISVNPFKEIDDFKRISHCISTAYKQIPKETPGIVHIELPYKDGHRLLDVTDPIFNRIFYNLKNYPRINAVCFSARTSQINTNPPGYSVRPFSVIIPNPNPRHHLPSEFELPFTNKDDPHNITGNGEGSMFIEVDLHEPLAEQSGKYLFEHISIHGYPQIRIWQSYHNIFRVDVVELGFGKYVFESDLNMLTGGMLKFVAIWSKEGIKCAANGRMLKNSHDIGITS
ncbi:hypothetical protein, partial [Desulfobacter postgatei]|uniref:hypothetical protein n=1 Tax=Desulfobacter postgatei TaxID=2293 RepID=UPI002A35E5D6